MSFRPSDAEIAYKLLLLAAIEVSEKFSERLEELYQKYPSQVLRETIENLRHVQQSLSPENLQEQECASPCSSRLDALLPSEIK